MLSLFLLLLFGGHELVFVVDGLQHVLLQVLVILSQQEGCE